MKSGSSLYLQEVYEKLEFQIGAGFYSLTDLDIQPALSRVGWIEQTRKLGADAIFFVGDYPAVLFFKLDNLLEADIQEYEAKIRELYLKVWNTSSVPLFFVALPFEIRVYSAYQKPIQSVDDWQAEDRWLSKVKTISQISKEWEDFSRSQIESGQLFYNRQKSFSSEDRVDEWLLQNLRQLRQKLVGDNIQKREYVHALIGRSIFIRYLEDRGVLVKDYFDIHPGHPYERYVDVLESKDDTYRLFEKLREDFNGDLFPLSGAEKDSVSTADLSLLSKFLEGRSMGEYPDLLFWAYRFDIIPIELISNIYEEFYYENGGEKDKGTHYTPTALVDFVLSQCLTPERLDHGARILDPACGSGIFLVETFKRMVYHQCQRNNIGVTQLPLKELTRLLTERIAGIDINQSAIQIAAFSLYLAFLDFRDPPDIRQNKKLPKLIYDPQQPDGGKSLFCTNTFYPTRTEQSQLPGEPLLPFDNEEFDVIVGNPPWGQDAGIDGQMAIKWCKAFDYPVGYKELSQCFIWRTQRLLKPSGLIGLLVSTGILVKHEENSKAFRRKWITTNLVHAVFNFAHVREVFFQKQKKDAIAPFAAVFFVPAITKDIDQNRISYLTVKQSTFIEQLQAIVIDKTDLREIRQSDLLERDWLWKTYMWGSLDDVDLITELKTSYKHLEDYVDEYGFGYEVKKLSKKNKTTQDLGVSLELSSSDFNNNIPVLKLLKHIPLQEIARTGNPRIYDGERLLIKRGISRLGNMNGRIQARLESYPFAFRNSICGFRLDSLQAYEREILLGIVLSSLTKYYHFLTCSTWGFWHDEIHLNEHLQLPVHFGENPDLQQRIIQAVRQITTQSGTPNLFDPSTPGWQTMQRALDDAIFDLYELSAPQRDLVRDLCGTTLEFFYEGADAQAIKPPTVDWLEAYLSAFLETWTDRLALKGAELETRIYAPHHGLLCGIVFELREKGTALHHLPVTDDAEWQHWLRQLSTRLRTELAQGIYIDRVLKEVSESSMFLIKRAERRFWTKSQARQDAEELLTEVFKLEWQQ